MTGDVTMLLRTKTATACLLIIMAGLLCAICQGQSLSFSHLTVENGLSQNSVLAIAQDSRGFMWFGTRNGLNRYDGRQFKVYKNNPGDTVSLYSNYVNALYNDHQGTLWAGTQTGLNRYNPKKDAFERIAADSAALQPGVNCIYSDKSGRLWIGTVSGLYEVGAGGHKLNGPFYKASVLALYEDNENSLWMGTPGGLVKWVHKNKTAVFEHFKHDDSNPTSLGNNYIRAIAADKQQNIWVGSDAGIDLFDKETGSFTHFVHQPGEASIVHNSVRRILPDSTGKLWIATQEGLSILDPATKKFSSYQNDPQNKKSLSQNSIHSIFRDRGGALWAGTYFGGINVVYPSQTAFTIYQYTGAGQGLSNDVVSSIVEDPNNNLWVGTEGGGLNYFNRKTGSFTSYQNKQGDPQSLSSNLVKLAYYDKAGNLWVSTHAGDLSLMNPVTQSFTHYFQKFWEAGISSSEIVAVREDSYGRLWTGSSIGLGWLKKNAASYETYITKAPTEYKLQHNNVKCIFEDKDKNLWIGTMGGLHVFWDKTKTMQVFLQDGNNPHSLQSDIINCITQDSHGNIWVGTYFGGLAKYNAAEKNFTSYTQQNGLPDNNVLGILEDGTGALWISTGNGLSRFDPTKKNFQNYTQSDGLAGNEFNNNSFFKDSRGELFFGGFKGLTSFFPANIETNQYVAPIYFTSLRLFNQPVEINGVDGLLAADISQTEKISFRHNQDVFTIEFALLNYIKPGKNKYAYMLEGLDKGWTETNTPSITYTHLPQGNYTLLVKGANNDGVWGTKPARMHISVLPPFWKTWWAYLIYTLLFAALLFFITRFFFLRELLKKEDELHQAKLSFFTNISHEIRTHLALIIGPVERMLLAKKEDDGDSGQLRYIKKNSESLLQLVNELMDFRKAESGNLQLHVGQTNMAGFVQEIFGSFESLAASKNISTHFIATAENIQAWFDREQLEKVLFNLIGNAFKFTPAGGNITVSVEEKKTSIEVKVADNGKGIAPENLEKLFLNYYQENDYGKQNTGYGIGLALSKSIVELHKGTLAVSSEAGKDGKENNTCFTLTLQKGNTHFTATQLQPLAPSGEPYPLNYLPAGLPTTTPASNSSSTDKPTDKQYTVLVVEDNAEVRAFMRESLQGQYEVIESVNGLAGWECAVELVPDLIITDVMMPEMDGLTLCGKLKQDERTSHIPVIMLTAQASTASQVGGLEMGADIYLTKPFSIQVLLLHVRNLLASRERMRQKFSATLSEILLPDTSSSPSTLASPSASAIDEAFLEKMMQVVETHIDDPELGVELICKKVAMSRTVLYKKLKAVTDMSVNDFVKSVRLKKAMLLLRQDGQYNINEVAYMVGFSDRKYFSKEFKKQFGITPSEYAGGDKDAVAEDS